MKLFKNKKYIKQLGQDTKLSLDNYNFYILKAWNALFDLLKKKKIEFQNLKKERENKLINLAENSETKQTKNLNITNKNHTSHHKNIHKSKTKK